MLIIQNDPAGITGRHRHPWDFGMSIQDNIAEHISEGGGCVVTINGEVIDPATDPRMECLPRDGDRVVVTRRPEGLDPITWAYIAIGALAVATYLAMPKPPSNMGGAAGKDSPNNQLTGQTNIARAYQAIPDVYGYRRVWPDLIQPSSVEYIDNIKYVTEWLCVSRGKGTITAVQYAETPIGDIPGASYELFEPVGAGYPEHGTTTLLDVLETFESDEVNGQELTYPTPFAVLSEVGDFAATAAESEFEATFVDGPEWDQLKSLAPSGSARVVFSYIDSGSILTDFDQTCTVLGFVEGGGNVTFTFSSPAWTNSESDAGVSFTITPLSTTPHTIGPFTLPVDGSRLRWNTVFLRGLVGAVTIRAEWWRVDEDGDEVSGTRQTQDNTYTADTFDQQFYTNDATPTGGIGRYRIEFTRLTSQIGDGGADVAKLEEVYAVRHYPEKELPGVTVIRMTTKATTEATGFSGKKYNVRWARHVRSLTSTTLSTSRNFARAMTHIWCVAGNDLAGLDVDELAAINAEHGEDSVLLRFDGSLDDEDMSLGSRLQLIADTARCVVWRDGTKWTVTREQARQYPDVQFDYRNLASGGESVLTYSAHLPASHDGVEVEYVDELSQSKKTYIRLNISTGAPVVGQCANPKKIRLVGCATEDQADNRAQLEARRLLYQRQTISDTALSDGNALGLGALVRWVDPNDFGGDDGLQAGEVTAVSGSSIMTSEPVDWRGEASGRILFTGADGRQLGAPVVCYPGDGAAIELSSVPVGLYTASEDRQCGSRYAFTVGLTQAETEAAGLFTVTDIKPGANGAVSLACASYDERMFEAD